jgi:hypothetical protein
MSSHRASKIFCLLLAWTLAATAHAETFSFVVSPSATGALNCKASGKALTDPAGLLRVDVKLLNLSQADDTNSSFTLQHSKKKPDGSLEKDDHKLSLVDPSTELWRTEVKDLGDKEDTNALSGSVLGKAVDCGSFKLGTITSSTPAPSAQEDLEALKWLLSEAGQTALANLRKVLPRKVEILPHLPSGAIATPYPESVAENTKLQVVVVTSNSNPKISIVDVKTCADTVHFRIDTASLTVLQKAIKGQAGGEEPFVLLPVGKPFRCGQGTAVYNVHPVGETGTDTSLRMRPVYHLAAAFAYGFDFGRQTTFTIEDQKIVRNVDDYGTTGKAGFVWFPTGVDYEHLSTVNRWLNPTLVFNLKSPTEDFVLGNSFTVTGGLSLLVGASIHKVTLLKDGFKPGDPFTGKGDLPTRKKWDKDGIGWFVGVSLDSNVFTAVKDIFKSGSQSAGSQSTAGSQTTGGGQSTGGGQP